MEFTLISNVYCNDRHAIQYLLLFSAQLKTTRPSIESNGKADMKIIFVEEWKNVSLPGH